MDEKPEIKKEPKAQQSSAPPVKVRIIKTEGAAALVEWNEDGVLKRAHVEVKAISDSDGKVAKVGPKALKRGIAYGIPWEELITLSATPEQLAAEMRKQDLWTFADVISNVDKVFSVLRTVYGVDVPDVLHAARLYEKEQG